MSKHTPGPWRIVGEAWIRGPDGAAVAFCDHKDREVIQANTLLIAAAPDLLEAAKDFVAKVDRGDARSTDSYAKFSAAIAKAEKSA